MIPVCPSPAVEDPNDEVHLGSTLSSDGICEKIAESGSEKKSVHDGKA